MHIEESNYLFLCLCITSTLTVCTSTVLELKKTQENVKVNVDEIEHGSLDKINQSG